MFTQGHETTSGKEGNWAGKLAQMKTRIKTTTNDLAHGTRDL